MKKTVLASALATTMAAGAFVPVADAAPVEAPKETRVVGAPGKDEGLLTWPQERAIINGVGLSVLLGGVAAVIAAAVTGKDVFLDVLNHIGVSPRI